MTRQQVKSKSSSSSSSSSPSKSVPASLLARCTLSLSLSLSLLASTSAVDPDCGSASYSGFALKSKTSCKSYVYCQNGAATSETTCPEGLLFNGGVGQGGICTWADTVQCEADADVDVDADAARDADADANVPAAMSTATAATATTATTPAAIASSDDNPDNYYCGQSREDAATHCQPCPSGSLLDCQDVTHGCFARVDECSATAAAQSQSTLSSFLTGLMDGLSEEEADTDADTTATAPVPSPTVVDALGDTDTDIDTPQPTDAPTLPPWTNAPFVPYRGAPRPKTVIGYYASWQWYDRNKFADPKNIDFSKYDRIHYAFFQPDKEGRLYGTDEWADPQLLWGDYDYNTDDATRYFCSWDGPDESQHHCNYHSGEGIVSRAKAAGAQVVPSIGGWTLSDNFPTIAATEAGRNAFAANCVKLIEAHDFDGIDIDWEYPAYEDHSGTPDDTVNYTLLLRAIRDALDILGKAKNRKFPLTAALPCGPDKIEKIQVDQIKDILDEFNLMSYDMHGAWDLLTGTNAPMFDQGWGDQSKRWSTHGCTETYLEFGVPIEKINIGLPFYGRSFRKATGMKQVHEGPDDINYHLDEGSPQYFNIVKALGRMTTYRHEKTQTQYAVFDDTGGLVSYDDARAICDKVHYANQRGLNGFLVWEISGDMLDNGETPLIDATNAKINNPDLDCSTLRDPLWALSDTTYLYAPPEPETVDWSSVDPLKLAAPMGYNNGNNVPAPSPSSPSTPTNVPPTLSAKPSGIPNNSSPSVSSGNTDGKGNESPGDCPPDHTGYWASADCTKYMYCNAGAVVGALMPCVPGTLFDVTTATCAFAANVAGCSR